MIRINQLKLELNELEPAVENHSVEELESKLLHKKIEKMLHIHGIPLEFTIVKKSIDARKHTVQMIYSVELDETMILKHPENKKKLSFWKKNKDIILLKKDEMPDWNTKFEFNKGIPFESIIVVGSGPAGLFCAYALAKAGLCPTLLERGDCVTKRMEKVEHFWKTNEFDAVTNVQFGEGGAGTFSDGKLNTMVKDKTGLNFPVLKIFVDHGAPSEIMYLNKPHIGTDNLRCVVENIRNEIIALGGTVRFLSQLTDFTMEDNRIRSVLVKDQTTGDTEELSCDRLVLAIGHSARDTFELLKEKQLDMEKKPFAIGVRAEHLQKEINQNQYGGYEHSKILPAADYKFTYQTEAGRSVYSFCMCPGGYVVNASSEKGHLVVNGMSYHARDSKNANSAIVVSVTPEDFPEGNVLAGMYFQRTWEKLAYQCAGGNIPVQLYGDFKQNRVSTGYGRIEPVTKGATAFSNLRNCLPTYVCDALVEGIDAFGRKMSGFSAPDVLLSGIETRTSSPVRLLRDKNYESNIKGIYPCGEGAGYAGGITSAAMDGLRIARHLMEELKNKA